METKREPWRFDTADAISSARYVMPEGDPVVFDDLFEPNDDPHDLAALYRDAQQYEQAAKAVKEAVGHELAKHLGEGGTMRYGAQVLRNTTSIRKTLMVEPDIWWDWFDTQSPAVRHALFNPTAVRKTGFEKRGDYDTFFADEPRGEPRITASPIDLKSAPRWWADLEDGEIVGEMRT